MNNYNLILKDICKSYSQGEQKLIILDKVSLQIAQGEIIALVGPSGCGKSTLLHIAGLLDNLDTGTIIIDNKNCSHLSDNERTLIRNKKIGFVYQSHHLLSDFTAIENVMMPQIIAGIAKKNAFARSEELLAELGLSARLNHLPGELSGGEQQRVAIARALANRPSLLLADEPTGNLDPSTSDQVFNMLINVAKKENVAVLIVTHNIELAVKMDRTLSIKNTFVIEP